VPGPRRWTYAFDVRPQPSSAESRTAQHKHGSAAVGLAVTAGLTARLCPLAVRPEPSDLAACGPAPMPWPGCACSWPLWRPNSTGGARKGTSQKRSCTPLGRARRVPVGTACGVNCGHSGVSESLCDLAQGRSERGIHNLCKQGVTTTRRLGATRARHRILAEAAETAGGSRGSRKSGAPH
jgi:hypothetical protein